MRFLATLIMLLTMTVTTAMEDNSEQFKPVVQIFSGLSYANHDMIRDATVDGFLLLEVGEVWDMDYLLSLIKPSSAIRKNYFSIISVEDFGDVALINYWNKALITNEGKVTTRAWLESVVAVKTDKGWKLQQMHSTRIEPDTLPKDIKLTEMMVEK